MYIFDYHTQLAKMSFDKIFDLRGGVYIWYLYNRRYTKQSSGRVSSVSGVCGIIFFVFKQAVALTNTTLA